MPESNEFQRNNIRCTYSKTLDRWTARVKTVDGMVVVEAWAGLNARGKVEKFASTHTTESALEHYHRKNDHG